MNSSDSLAAAIRDNAAARREEILSTLCDLIHINTVNPHSGDRSPGGEKPGQLYLEPLMFAHMDTVGVDTMDIPPFDPVRKEGRIYGRGSSDDKSGLALGFHAIKTMLAVNPPARGKLTFASVVGEECDGGGGGIMSLCLDGLKPDAAVCLDGSASSLFRGCNGVMTGRIRVPGESAHASSPLGGRAAPWKNPCLSKKNSTPSGGWCMEKTSIPATPPANWAWPTRP